MHPMMERFINPLSYVRKSWNHGVKPSVGDQNDGTRNNPNEIYSAENTWIRQIVCLAGWRPFWPKSDHDGPSSSATNATQHHRLKFRNRFPTSVSRCLHLVMSPSILFLSIQHVRALRLVVYPNRHMNCVMQSLDLSIPDHSTRRCRRLRCC